MEIGNLNSSCAMKECQMCTSPETNQPSMLQCEHDFCNACLHQLYHTTDESANTKNIFCPICNELTSVKNESMQFQFKADCKNFPESSQNNHKENDEITSNEVMIPCSSTDNDDSGVESLSPSTTKRKDFCAVCDILNSSHLCEYCNSSLCQNSIEPKTCQRANAKNVPFVKCNLHKDCDLKYYCLLCMKIICSECYIELHKLHDVETVDETLQKLNAQVFTYTTSARGNIDNNMKEMAVLMHSKSKYRELCQEIKTKILQHTHIVIAKVERDSLSLIKQVEEQQMLHLQELEQTLDHTKERLSKQHDMLQIGHVITCNPDYLKINEIQKSFMPVLNEGLTDVPNTSSSKLTDQQITFLERKLSTNSNTLGELNFQSGQ